MAALGLVSIWIIRLELALTNYALIWLTLRLFEVPSTGSRFTDKPNVLEKLLYVIQLFLQLLVLDSANAHFYFVVHFQIIDFFVIGQVVYDL